MDVEEGRSQGSEESAKPLSGSSWVSNIPTASGRSREDGWRKGRPREPQDWIVNRLGTIRQLG